MPSQLEALVRQLTISQRIGIVGGALASVAILVAFVMWAGTPDYQPAFTNLSPADAGAISEALRTAKIPFQVTDAGTTVLVPQTSLADARVAAAQAGVTTDSSTQGFSLFDKSGFGMSEFDQQVTYQRALEGQLTQTIQSMAGVSSAQVAIVQAQSGLFSDQDKPATASVVLKMRNGMPADAALVRGIVSTVAGSVAGLTADNVTVVDDQGHVLAGTQDSASAGALATQQAVEGQLSAKVQSLVDQALGPGHASVAVAATMDFNKVEQEITTYAPVTTGNYTPVSVHTITEQYAGSNGSSAGGVPGAVSNIPGLPQYPGNLPAPTAAPSASPGASASPAASPTPSQSTAVTASASPGGYVHTEETVNYDLSQTVQKVSQEPGLVKRLSVGVLIDQAAMGSITPDTLKTAIEAAIGADTTRGDVVSVSAVPFAAAASASKASSSGASDMLGSVGGIAGTVFGILIALVLLFLVWRNMRALGRRADDMTLLASASVPTTYDATGATVSPVLHAELPEPTPQARIQERLRMVADERPDALVGLMHGWLREDQKKS